MSVEHTPDLAIRALYPRLVVSDGVAAIDFYRAALSAREVVRYTGPDGGVVHAELRVGGTTVTVTDNDQFDRPPGALGGTPVTMILEVADADAVADAMLRAGASVLFPIGDQPYGERAGRLADPFGHQWMITQRIEDLTVEEVQARTEAMLRE